MILISPTAYKGTLSPLKAARLFEKAVKQISPNQSICKCPLADGGDGTLEVLMAAFHGQIHRTRVTGPLGTRVWARWGLVNKIPSFRGPVAVLEMAEASGLKLIKGRNRILEASTEGTGELIKSALERGCRTILIGVGGTATADGGAGALRALGLRYFDRRGVPITGRPKDLSRLDRIDWGQLDPRLARVKIFVLCDVTNPLLGPKGSAFTFGPQKGASPRQVLFLEKTMRRWSRYARWDIKNHPGSGAAGALAFGLAGFLGARLVQGCPFILKTLNWTAAAKHARIILTGEGRVDQTSFSGKVIGEVCRKRGQALVGVVCGTSSFNQKALQKKGVRFIREMGAQGKIHPEQSVVWSVRDLLKEIFAPKRRLRNI